MFSLPELFHRRRPHHVRYEERGHRVPRGGRDARAERAGVEIKRPHQKPGEQGLNESIYAKFQKEAMAYFIESLPKSTEAVAYIKGRALTEETVAAFSLGHAPDGWHGLQHLRTRFRRRPNILGRPRGRGRQGPYDMFRHRVMFPPDHGTAPTVAFGGRVMGEGEPNSPETPIFKKGETLYAMNMAGDQARDASVVVEGYMDTIACHQGGIKKTSWPRSGPR